MAITLSADDKKKAYLLGAVLGVLGLAGIFVFANPFGGGSPEDVETPSTLTNAPSATSPSNGPQRTASLPPNGSAQFGADGAVLPGAGATRNLSTSAAPLTPQIPGIGRTRIDPFVPETIPAIPPPTRRIVVPVPVNLPQYSENVNFGLPSPTVVAPTSGQSALQRTLFLPPATIFGGTQRTAPPDDLRFPGGLDVGAPGEQTSINRTNGKRVAGVILGDSIRALIEYQENGQTVSRVVQPGDEVGGMRILSIQRIKIGDNFVVRVTVRENGQEEYFDLGDN